MIEQSFSTKYEVVQENYIVTKGISFAKVKSNYDKNQMFLMRKINRNYFKSKQQFFSYTCTKWINILDPVDVFEKEDYFLIIFQNLIDYQLTGQKLENCSENCIRKILLQLTLTSEEMIRRKIKWNIFSSDQIYKMNNNYILLSMSDIQDNYFLENYDIFESFQNFLNESICQSHPVFKKLRSLRTFKEIISELLSNLGIQINPNDMSQTIFLTENSPLLEFLKIYFNPIILDQSDVFQIIQSVELETPDIFKQVFGVKSNTIEKRSQKLLGEVELINQDREIEYQVLVQNCPNIQSAFCYVRIFQQAIFFFSKPTCSLQEGLHEALQIDNLTYKKVAYKILYDIIIAINYLHNLNIIHRNITLETCFLTYEKLDNQNIYLLGNLSSSKRLSSKNIQIESTSLNTNSSSAFMPPDNQREYSIKADLYQFGLLSLFVLNKGKQLFNYTGLSRQEINQQFSAQNLSRLLEPFGYQNELIEIVANCLKYNPMDRPETEQIQKVIQTVYLHAKIKIISSSVQKG